MAGNTPVSASSVDVGVLGTSGLNIQGGHIYEEWHRSLQGEMGPRKWREMGDSSATAGPALRMLRLLMGQAAWRVVENPASASAARAMEAAQHVEECMGDMAPGHTWQSFMGEADSDLEYGWALFEICYKWRKGPNGTPSSKYNDGRVGWDRFAIRKQETRYDWDVARDGTIVAMTQLALPSYVPVRIPMSKCVLFRHDPRANNPEGRSFLRNAYEEYEHGKKIRQFEGVGVERDTAGIPDMQAPANVVNPASGDTEAQAAHNSIIKQLANFRNGEYAYMLRPSEIGPDGQPTGNKFGLIGSAGSKLYDTDKIINRCNRLVALALNAEVMMLGMESKGSYALADSKTDTLGYAVAALLDAKEAVINQQIVEPLMRINGFAPDTWPTIEHGDVETPDIAAFASAMNQLVTAGVVTPDLPVENRAREYLSLPPRVEEMPTVQGEIVTTGDAASAQSATTGDFSLAFQRLMNAKTMALNAGDSSLVSAIDAKLREVLARV